MYLSNNVEQPGCTFKSSSAYRHEMEVMQFLLEFHDFMCLWEKNKIGTFSKETFFAMKQTCVAIVECCKYLLDETEFKSFLIGHLQSDPIEARFGWLRQMSGGNYFISMRQALESNEKIKMFSLLKHSKLTLEEIDNFIDDISECVVDDKEDEVAIEIVNLLGSLNWPSHSESGTIYYIAGAHSIFRCTKCQEILLDDE